MDTNSDAFQSGSGLKTLSPEILLDIFLNLASHQTVTLRSVCKEFLEVIDNNKSLWRVLEWKQQEEECPVQALEMFDEKSASTLREVSIFQAQGEPDDRFIEILDRSKNSLTILSFTIRFLTIAFRLKMIELASNCQHLESMVLWYSDEDSLSLLPKTRLARSSRQSCLGTERSRNLQVLWCFNLAKEWNGKLDVSSLVSFADKAYYNSLQIRSFIIKFSSTLTHLFISSDNGITTPSLSCPSLRILEGRFFYGFPSWLAAPNLQIVIASSVGETFVQGLPISVQELWLLSLYSARLPANFWDSLPLICPKLKVTKFGRRIFKANSESKDILKALRAREAKIEEGVKIEGIKMASLEKLILPTDLFTSSQLDDLREIVREVVDIEEYPDFIELEY